MFEILYLVLAFMLGIGLGSWIEALNWRHNADMIQRKESGGRLYKVSHADP